MFACAVCAFGAVDGTVVNRTTGKPQAGAVVTLYKLGQAGGMQPVTTVRSDAGGKFLITQDADGPRLLQTVFGGVVYSQMLSPGTPTSGLSLDVFDTSNKPDVARLTSHFLVFQPSGARMTVTEGFIFQNDSKVSYSDSLGGTLRFHLPAAAQGNVKVQATAPQGMPVERSAAKTAKPDIYKVDFPIKPGETRFELTYSVPYAAPSDFSSRSLYKDTPTSLVAPPGVELKGAGLTLRGQEPRSQANVYEVRATEFKVQVAGAMKVAEESEAAGGDPSIEQVLPRMHGSLAWILALTFAVLALGFALLYRARLAEATVPPRPATKKGANERRRR